MKVISIQEAVTVEVQRDALAAKLLVINEYCQKNKIGEWGASASEALIAHCDALAAQLKHQTERAEMAEVFIEQLAAELGARATVAEAVDRVAQWLDADHGGRLAEVRADAMEAASNALYDAGIADEAASDWLVLYAAKVRGGSV